MTTQSPTLTQPQKVSTETGMARLERLFALQQEAFMANPYPSAKQRKDLMRRIPDMLAKYRQQIQEALREDFGHHSTQQADLVEILGMYDRAKHNISQVSKWMRPSKRTPNFVTLGSSKAYLKYHPKGVVGNMVSWNFPFDIAIGPTLDALAAGNKVIIKPSEYSPACGAILQEMIAETFDEQDVAVVNGGLDLAVAFSQYKWDHLLYTGSGAVGKKVMEAAAKNLVPVTLELGGKCPAIIDKDAITKATVTDIAGVKVVKRGQMCVTVDHCLVPSASLDTFTDLMVSHFDEHFSEDNGAAHSTGIISDRHLKRLQSLVDDARAKGAEVHEIGAVLPGNERNMPFYIVKNPPADALVMQEEIFGPILPILPYDNKEDVIHRVNAGDRPLGLYVFSKDKSFIDDITTRTRSGGVAINIAGLQAAHPAMPFGGIGESGMGHHHGVEAFREFSNPRGYFIKGKGGAMDRLTAPYTDRTDNLIEKAGYASLGKQAIFALKNLPANLWAQIVG